MIAYLRHLVLDDFLHKLFSLALAVLIWLTVTFASHQSKAERPFLNLPVVAVSSAGAPRNFTIEPKTVDVTLQGGEKTLDSLEAIDIRVRVDLTGLEAAHDLSRPVEVVAPLGVAVVRVTPAEVRVSNLNKPAPKP